MLVVLNTTALFSQNKSDEYVTQSKEKQAIVWQQLPYQWNEGAFLGNGMVGMMVYVDSLDNSLALHLSRPDITDHRKAPGCKTSLGVKGASVMFDFCRLDVGKMKLYPKGKIVGGAFTLDIYDGILKGTLITTVGKMNFTAFTPYQHEVNIIEYSSDSEVKCAFIPGNPCSPRVQCFPNLKKEENYQDNPNPQMQCIGNSGVCVQKLLVGGDYATVWKEIKNKDKRILYISIKNETPLDGKSVVLAKENIDKISCISINNIKANSVKWWNQYQRKSMISIPDKKMENFYAIQMYKIATCSNPAGPAMDNFGTFFKMSQWPGLWWNLNVQLTYQSLYINNRLEQAKNYQKLIDDRFIDIINNIPVEKAGDYGWALQNYYLYMLYKGETSKVICDAFRPKAMALLKLYQSRLVYMNGVYTLKQMESPEYEGFKVYDNSNYNLGILRWLLQTLIKYELVDSNSIKEWKCILDKLPPFQQNENGFMIAQNVPLEKSHRHYSHLLPFYPLHLMNVDEDGIRKTLETSLCHWLTIGEGKGLAGYSYTGSASLYALLGNGNKAYKQLSHFINKPIGISLLLPNTMYVESDGKNPVIETPLSASTALAEMMLQSWGGIIRVFPAIPDKWNTCCFDNLRAEGGINISAQWQDAKTKWVKIAGEVANHCKIKIKGWENIEPVVISNNNKKVMPLGNGVFEFYLDKGETVILAGSKGTNTFNFKYAPSQTNETNFYGVKKGKGLPYRMDWPANNY